MVPRLLEKVHARIDKQVAESHGLKRRLGRWALNLAESPSAHHGWSVGVADALVYKKLRSALGGNLRYLVVGGAALSLSLERFLRNVGIPVYTGYGLTEASPVISVNCPSAVKEGTVGKIFPGVEVRFDEQHQILARGPGIMAGYHHDAVATAATIKDGWLHTGDRGELDAEGYLTITGRIKELFKTSNGKYICPVPIEQALAEHELIDMAMVIAEGRRFVACLLFTDPEVIRRRKTALGLSISDDEYLARQDVREEVERHVSIVNSTLDRWEQVRRWSFITTTPTVEREELTPTMKLRRHVLAERQAALIEAMYTTTNDEAAGPGTLVPPLHDGQLVKEQP
jgi:long-chain acyl-CoA synthetase